MKWNIRKKYKNKAFLKKNNNNLFKYIEILILFKNIQAKKMVSKIFESVPPQRNIFLYFIHISKLIEYSLYATNITYKIVETNNFFLIL